MDRASWAMVGGAVAAAAGWALDIQLPDGTKIIVGQHSVGLETLLYWVGGITAVAGTATRAWQLVRKRHGVTIDTESSNQNAANATVNFFGAVSQPLPVEPVPQNGSALAVNNSTRIVEDPTQYRMGRVSVFAEILTELIPGLKSRVEGILEWFETESHQYKFRAKIIRMVDRLDALVKSHTESRWLSVAALPQPLDEKRVLVRKLVETTTKFLHRASKLEKSRELSADEKQKQMSKLLQDFRRSLEQVPNECSRLLADCVKRVKESTLAEQTELTR